MQVTTLKDEATEFNAKISISSDVINSEIQKNLSTLSRKVKTPGFRPGKVPLSMIAKQYGPSVRMETIEKQVNSSINKVIGDNNLNIIGDPIVEELKDDEATGIEFIMKCYRLPNIEMPDFKKITIEKPILEITDTDIEEGVNELAAQYKVYTKEKNGKAAISDQVTLDCIGSIDGVEFEGGNLTNRNLVLGSKTFIDTFEDQLVGSSPGDEIIVNITFPANYQAKNLAGKPAEFKVKIHSVNEHELPEINDEFVAKFNCETVVELKERIGKNIRAYYDKEIHIMMKMNLFNQLNKILDIELPKPLIEKEKASLKQQVDTLVQDEKSLKNKTPEELEEYYHKLAVRRIKIGLLLSEYVNHKNLKITPEDIQNAILTQAYNYPGQEKSVIEFYQKDKRAIESLRGPILEEIAVNDLLNGEVVQIEEKKYSKDQLKNILSQVEDSEL